MIELTALNYGPHILIELIILLLGTCIRILPWIVQHMVHTPIQVVTQNGVPIQAARKGVISEQKCVCIAVENRDFLSRLQSTKVEAMTELESMTLENTCRTMKTRSVDNRCVYNTGTPPNNVCARVFEILGTILEALSQKPRDYGDQDTRFTQCATHVVHDATCVECQFHEKVARVLNASLHSSLVMFWRVCAGVVYWMWNMVFRKMQMGGFVNAMMGLNFIINFWMCASPELQASWLGSKPGSQCVVHGLPVTIHMTMGSNMRISKVAACSKNSSSPVEDQRMCLQFGGYDVLNPTSDHHCKDFLTMAQLSTSMCAGYKEQPIIFNVGSGSDINILSETANNHVVAQILPRYLNFWSSGPPVASSLNCHPNIDSDSVHNFDATARCTMFARSVHALGSSAWESISIGIVLRFLVTMYRATAPRGKDDERVLVFPLALQGQLVSLFCFTVGVSTFMPHLLCHRVGNLRLPVQGEWLATLVRKFEQNYVDAFDQVLGTIFSCVFGGLAAVF